MSTQPNPPDDAFGYLRYLGSELCQTLIAVSVPGVTTKDVHAGLDRMHFLAEEIWMLTVDVRSPRQ